MHAAGQCVTNALNICQLCLLHAGIPIHLQLMRGKRVFS